MNCSIISSQDKKEFYEIKSITLPALSGELQILPDHAESFIILKKGDVVLKNNKRNTLPVEGGVCHIKDNAVVIIS